MMNDLARKPMSALSAGKVGVWRIILFAGWVIFTVSLFAPGCVIRANAWWPEKIYPAYGALLWVMLAGLEPHNLRLGWIPSAYFLTAIFIWIGGLAFLLSPLNLLPRRGRAIKTATFWSAWALLAVWLPPLWDWLEDGNQSYLWGYYGVAIGYTLVSIALLLPLLSASRTRRGFEPVLKAHPESSERS